MENRIIRFRAWDKKTQRMLSPEYTETVMALVGWSGGDDYIFMQYTGLKDKNGKEIYEFGEINKKFIVLWNFNRFVLTDISTGDIIEFKKGERYENTREFVEEYNELPKD